MKLLCGLAIVTALAVPHVQAQTPGSEQELIKVENDWSQAALKGDRTALLQFYADEYIFTDEDGTISNKAKEISDISSGSFRLTSYRFQDLKVHIYGMVAVVTGQNTIKGVWARIDNDISGPYRFTDVFVQRDGRWQCVASQASRITER